MPQGQQLLDWRIDRRMEMKRRDQQREADDKRYDWERSLEGQAAIKAGFNHDDFLESQELLVRDTTAGSLRMAGRTKGIRTSNTSTSNNNVEHKNMSAAEKANNGDIVDGNTAADLVASAKELIEFSMAHGMPEAEARAKAKLYLDRESRGSTRIAEIGSL